MESLRRRDQRSGGGGGRFRAEIEMDRGFTMPRSPELGFVPAIREPLVKLQRPKYDFERWDWWYFDWPHDRLDANVEMRDSDLNATFEADQKMNEDFLSRKQLQLEKYEMEFMQQKQQENGMHGLTYQAVEPIEASVPGWYA